MNVEEILSQQESEVLEFKELCPDKNVFLSLMCAFANTTGGINPHDVLHITACSERMARNILSRFVSKGLLKKQETTKSARYTAA